MTPEESAEVARSFGLSIADAVSLRVLADDRAQAEKIAATFAAADATDHTALSAYCRQLFGDQEPPPPPAGETDLKNFTRDLFRKEPTE